MSDRLELTGVLSEFSCHNLTLQDPLRGVVATVTLDTPQEVRAWSGRRVRMIVEDLGEAEEGGR